LKLAPKDGRLWTAYCYSLFVLERWADMRDAAQQAVTFDDESSYAYQQLACAHAGLEDYDATIPPARRAVELDPKNAYAMYTLAVALLMKGKREGRSLLEKACRLNKALRKDAAGDALVQKALAALR
jgi:tetratricopeptide (TPR) repeat protein